MNTAMKNRTVMAAMTASMAMTNVPIDCVSLTMISVISDENVVVSEIHRKIRGCI